MGRRRSKRRAASSRTSRVGPRSRSSRCGSGPRSARATSSTTAARKRSEWRSARASSAQRGKEGASFPEQAVESLDDAARSARQAAEALKQGDADHGLDRQREAQRQLESAREQLQDDDEANGQPQGHGEGDGNASHDPVAIPDAKEHKGPEEFRRRVIRGLGLRSSGALKDAVQRYAEGLLR